MTEEDPSVKVSYYTTNIICRKSLILFVYVNVSRIIYGNDR